MGEINYQLILEYLGEIIKYSMPISIAIGLIERVVDMVIKAATGRGA